MDNYVFFIEVIVKGGVVLWRIFLVIIIIKSQNRKLKETKLVCDWYKHASTAVQKTDQNRNGCCHNLACQTKERSKGLWPLYHQQLQLPLDKLCTCFPTNRLNC